MKHMPALAGGFVGFDIGMGIGAGLGTVAAPLLGPLAPLAPVIGMLGGGLVGALAGEAAGSLPSEIAEWGGKLAATFDSPFLDSQRAYTARQRSMQMINRSHMNARSALSQEAAAYHM